jgi:uncharacterized protein YlxW (UPF0749 family)
MTVTRRGHLMTMTFEQLQSLMEQTMLGLAATNRALSETRAIADSNARAIEATNNSLNTKFEQLANAIIRNEDRSQRAERKYQRQQAEIRGLRVHTRRILEHWIGEIFPDDPDLDDGSDTEDIP